MIGKMINWFLIITFFICSHVSTSTSANSAGRVEYLPGFQGPLPFYLETGYVGVDENEDVQLFYYFIRSESDPELDPLMLWITGGPGCSSISGLLYEIGSIKFEALYYDGSFPTLILSPNSWTKMASIIFLDLPVGTGFSYARTTRASHSTDIQLCDQAYEFMRKSLFHTCRGEYRSEYISTSNLVCRQTLELYHECVDGIETAHVLEPRCDSIFQIKLPTQKLLNEHNRVSSSYCRTDGYNLVYYWINEASVREALHIRKGTITDWIRCKSDLNFTKTLSDVRPYHLNLSNKGYRSLVYSGDHDMIIPYQSTEAWIKDLNYSVIDRWRSWKLNGQIAGYTESYSNMMTYATVKGGGHTAPEYKPEECFAMFKRWISNQPL
ncbi:serine carboxypeptidase-like 13 isoform X3 [Helianthus annuus]|uniref:serine carboxypeptidase-like 13 isoform X3 n=1 Tax=Helianthus annuus TaxID=4232 RepID=UPI001652EE93|nr:serine carboxypeptidase-like 13 isoform X3 [Helianthus annuus]